MPKRVQPDYCPFEISPSTEESVFENPEASAFWDPYEQFRPYSFPSLVKEMSDVGFIETPSDEIIVDNRKSVDFLLQQIETEVPFLTYSE